MKQSWGFCKECKWWPVEPDASGSNLTMGYGIEEKLQGLLLRVSGASGCNRFMEGKAARA